MKKIILFFPRVVGLKISKSFRDIARKQCCGSGIRCFLDPWLRDGNKPGSGMNIQEYFSRSLETVFRPENT
jgi:hypothetical protein